MNNSSFTCAKLSSKNPIETVIQKINVSTISWNVMYTPLSDRTETPSNAVCVASVMQVWMYRIKHSTWARVSISMCS